MAGKSTTLMIRILADASQAAKAMKGAGGSLTSGMTKASLAASGLLGGLGLMGKAAADDAKAQALLAKSLKNNAGAGKASIAATEDWITKTTLATGVADDELRPALSALARATGDVSTSQKDMTTVLDVAAATGKDTQSVADAVAKAYAGNTTSLGKMVPGMDKAILKSGDMTKIMGELARMTGGSAATAADTAAGKWQRTQVAFNETKESIGGALLPAFDKLGGMLATFGGWASQNTGTVQILAGVLGGFALAILAVNTAMKVHAAFTNASTLATKLFSKESAIAKTATAIWTGIQWLFNAAMAANPIVLVILAIVALVVAIVIAYKKSETFRKIVAAAWAGIKTAALSVWNFLKTKVFIPFWTAMQALWKAVQTGAGKIGDAWAGLKNAFKGVWDWLKSTIFDPMAAVFDTIVGWIKTVIDWIGRIKIPKPVQWVIDHAKSAFGRSAVVVAPAPTVGGRGRTARAGTDAVTPGGGRDPLTSLTTTPQVVVQVSDRKMAQLVDVSIRASATSAARNLTRRRVVTV